MTTEDEDTAESEPEHLVSEEAVALLPLDVIEQYPQLAAHVRAIAHLEEWNGSDSPQTARTVQIESRPHNELQDVVDIREAAPELYEAVLSDMRSQTDARNAQVRINETIVVQNVENSKARNAAVTRGQWMAVGLFVASSGGALAAVAITDEVLAAAPFLAVGLVGAIKAIIDAARR